MGALILGGWVPQNPSDPPSPTLINEDCSIVPEVTGHLHSLLAASEWMQSAALVSQSGFREPPEGGDGLW